ncbi:O-methylsterigmatocystin oxidoreductase OS=Aspergillus parasiticus GN=ordA PE=3 SV=1 [Rhizoctonia solani AG-1 IB]|uniref:O-methylsterigmatocystin oxidoreductase n=1 Tax=Thanatephorus cucumeris (strain AG1-IB / isolate 7/3/14) TaxID=1108050 RepID=A0A0B7FJA2_THACB|nr:O-methylsterigmatocystin oxidoreductase OS=Aspergillus parasiticus GN=ordA PE=3 SV=1 [Rhizoctonia solani AG-1 IB]
MISIRDALWTGLVLIAPAFGWYYYKARSHKIAIHPPSPLYLPFFGHLFSLPSGPEHVLYAKLGKDLKSDIIYLNLLGHDIIVLNSSQVASELLDKRSSMYSDRFCPLMFRDKSLFDWSTSPALLGYNDIWRHHRRMMNKWLNVRDVAQFHKTQETRTRSLLQRLLTVSNEATPFDSVKNEFYFAMGSSIFQMVYGYITQGKSDPFFRAAHEADEHATKAVMITNFYVNIFPFLNHFPEWMPGTGWKRTVRDWREQKVYALNAPFRWTQNQVNQGTSEPSIIGDLLQDNNIMSGLSNEERDNRLKELAHVLYSGGTDTTSSLLLSFVAAMVLNPHVQTQAQTEIDLILGFGVLPTMSDRERLPYVNRLILELMRWRPALPIGLPHRCSQDDTYRGYNIAKGSIMIGNIWSMSRDEKLYQDPETFNPNRFLDPEVPPIPIFGWGRRKCPGIYFGEASLFITISSLLAMFTFSKKNTSNGGYIEPLIEDTSNSLIIEMKPFEFEFAVRSEMHYRVINNGADSRS